MKPTGWELSLSNSPTTYYALTVEMGREIERIIDQISTELYESSNVQAIVLLQGEGDQAFSAGGHLEWLHSLKHHSVHAKNTDAMIQFYHSFLSMRQKIPVSILAALSGPDMGAGSCLALACDVHGSRLEGGIVGHLRPYFPPGR